MNRQWFLVRNVAGLLMLALVAAAPITGLAADDVTAPAGPIRYEVGNFDDDPEGEILLGNSYVTLILEPQSGGVISKISYHGMDVNAEANYGILGDHVITQKAEGDWWNTSYRTKILEHTPRKISLRLSRTGQSGVLAYLTFNKTVTLWHDRSTIQVDYDIALSEEAQATLEFGFWFHHMAAPDGAWDENKYVTYFFPTESGVQRLTWHPRAIGDHWYYKPARGWTGFVDRRTGTGLAYGLDYKYVACYYVWADSGFRGKPTHEWRFNKVPIPHGESFKTRLTIQPFHGLTGLSGAGADVVGRLDLEKDAPVARLISGRKADLRATLRYRILPGAEWTHIGTKELSLQADTPVSLPFPFQPEANGTYVFSLVVEEAGKEVLDLEGSRTLGNATGTYALAPKEKQYRPKERKFDLAYTSMDIETPHIKWARPYARGKTKAIILMGGWHQREIIELAQRLDLDFDTTYLHHQYPREFGDYPGVLTSTHLKNGLADLLERKQDWEVFVVPGFMLQYFSADQMKMILDKVKEGRGLVLIDPDHGKPMLAPSPLRARGTMARASWKKEQDHFITAGIPFDALPPTDSFAYKLEDGETLISAKGNPLLAVSRYGKGRVAALTYRSSPRRNKGAVGLLPLMQWRGGDLVTHPTFDYHEYHFSLLAKTLLWAAKKEPDVLIRKIAPGPFAVHVTLENQGDARPAELVLVLKDKYAEQLHTQTAAVQLPKGEARLTLPVYALPRQGVNLFDLFVRDESGRIINWGSAALEADHAVALDKVETDKEFYRPGDVIALNVGLRGEPTPAHALRVQLVDGYGRLVAEKEGKADAEALSFQFPLRTPVNAFLEVRVALTERDGAIDTLRLYRAVRFPLEDSAHEGEPVFLGWGSYVYNGVNTYLIDHYQKRLADVGVNADMWRAEETLRSNWRAGLRNNWGYYASGWGVGAHARFKGDPDHPERDPSLSAPALRASTRKAAAARARSAADGAVRILGFMSGDENQFSNYGRDACFSPHALAEFRTWLRTQYPSLQALNAQWDTDFKAWDDVLPLTFEECKQRGNRNYSSWCDHRTFGQVSFAGYFGAITEEIDQVDPRLGHGISGTPYADTYRGYDYWRLAGALSSAMPYSGTQELTGWNDRSFRAMRWSGPSTDVGRTKVGIFRLFFTGNTGVGICATRRLFKPDLRYSPGGLRYQEAYAPVREGVGRLLIGSTLAKHPIAMHYSQNSVHMSYVFGKELFWRECREGFRDLCAQTGFDVVPISYEEVENGRLKNFRALCLPLSYSLSDREVGEIERFVKQGGLLIAQLGTGIADGHGRLRLKGSLDHVLGINRSESAIVAEPGTLTGTASAGDLRMDAMRIAAYESGITPTTARVLAELKDDKRPVVFVNSFGKGTTLYLACDLFPSWSAAGKSRPIGDNARYASSAERFITSALARAGVDPWLDIRTSDGEPAPFTTSVLFRNGETRYFGVLHADAFARDDKRIVIRFPEKGYLYDVLADRTYGRRRTIKTRFAPHAVKIYSWLPRRSGRLRLSLEKRAVRPGEGLAYRISLASRGRSQTHFMRMEVIDPDGQTSTAYSQNLTVVAGSAEGVIPLALNDEPGRWRILLRDLTSGRKREARFEVGP